MRIGINCGHTLSGTIGSGAVGYINESDETRKVGYALIKLLKDAGNEVIDCTNDKAASVSDNLSRICSMANNSKLDIFLSIHFNSGGGKGSEVFTYGGNDKAFAKSIVNSLENVGFKNRGIKDGSNLYVVRRTTAPSCLVEICFVDSKEDVELYKKIGAENVAKAIVNAIMGNNSIKEDLLMTQYEELKSEISKLENKVNDISVPIYNYVDKNLPAWSKDTVKKLLDREILKGDGNELNLSEDMLRVLVMNDRAGLYD